MKCPKCNEGVLEEGSKNRWYCPYVYPNEYKVAKDGSVKEIKGAACSFACGLAFFIEDENANIKSEVGLSIENLKLSTRAKELIESKVLGLNEIDRADEIEKLDSIKAAENHEQEWDEYNAMMREVVGRSPHTHRIAPGEEGYRRSGSIRP